MGTKNGGLLPLNKTSFSLWPCKLLINVWGEQIVKSNKNFHYLKPHSTFGPSLSQLKPKEGD